jgi:uncharacterized phage protein gp47/JayE
VSISLVGKVALRVIAFTQAAKLKLIYLLIGDVQRNITPDTAYSTANGGTLERWGLIKIDRNPLPATQGQYTCTVTGTTGGTIPASTTFKSDDDSLSPGYLFVLDNEFTLSGSSGSITLRALTGGTESKLSAGNTLTATQPLINVNTTATVTAETVSPTDTETTELYREKVIDSFRLLPQGGASADYRLWGKTDISGVQEIYPYAKSGYANEIDIYIEATPADSTDGKGTPTATIITNVTNAIEAKRPLGVFEVHYLPVTVKEVTINIAGSTFTTSQKALILTAMTEAIARIRPFIPGADTLTERNDVLSANNVINVVLNTVPGSVFGAVTVYIPDSPPTPVASYQFTNGEIPWLDTITYI